MEVRIRGGYTHIKVVFASHKKEVTGIRNGSFIQTNDQKHRVQEYENQTLY